MKLSYDDELAKKEKSKQKRGFWKDNMVIFALLGLVLTIGMYDTEYNFRDEIWDNSTWSIFKNSINSLTKYTIVFLCQICFLIRIFIIKMVELIFTKPIQ